MRGPIRPRFVPPPYQDSESGRLVLRDGSTAHVRRARPEDREEFVRFFGDLSAESRYRRFLSVSTPEPDLIARLAAAADPSSERRSSSPVWSRESSGSSPPDPTSPVMPSLPRSRSLSPIRYEELKLELIPLVQEGTLMTELKSVNELFDTLARILLRCFVLGYALLLLWFTAFLAAGDMLNGAYAKLFGLTQQEANMVHYYGIAFVKCVVLLFFLFPYVAIRLVLRTRT